MFLARFAAADLARISCRAAPAYFRIIAIEA
jgi:hypothetical protein